MMCKNFISYHKPAHELLPIATLQRFHNLAYAITGARFNHHRATHLLGSRRSVILNYVVSRAVVPSTLLALAC